MSNFVYIRYADDFVVLSNGSRKQAEELKEELYQFLNDRLRLNLSKEKTKVTHLNDGFNFLGFRIQRRLGREGMKTKILIPKEAVERMIEKIKTTTDKTTHQDSLNSKILALNRITGGWCRYYQYTSKASSVFNDLRKEVFWALAHWIGRKYQLAMPEVMRRYQRDSTIATEHYRLTMPDEFPTKFYKYQVRKPNPYITQVRILREELPQDTYWTGYEPRPGMADLRPMVLERDGHICQMCDKPVTTHTSQIDHLRPVRRFKRPVDANSLNNLWTLCVSCHKEKTKSDRQMESRMR